MSIKKLKGLLVMIWNQFVDLAGKLYTSDSKSTVLKDLKFPLTLLIIAFSGLASFKTEPIYLYFIGGLVTLFVAVFIFAFLYCLIKNPNLIRTEEHIERTMAIKKGFFGDNLFGFLANKKEKSINNITPEDQSQSVEDNSK